MYEIEILDDTRARVLRREGGYIVEVVSDTMPIEQAKIKVELMNRNTGRYKHTKV